MHNISHRLSSTIVQAMILAAISLPYCIRIGSSSIWNASEAFYAETSREMMVSGNYLAPRFNFEPRTQKPPLTYWAILFSYRLFGVNEFSARFPGCIAAVAIILFSFTIARFLFNPRIALITAVITATTARVLILARRLPIDLLLMFFLSGTFLFLLRAIQTKKRFYWVLFYLFAGAGFLTKGPIAVFIPAGVYLIWTLRNRKFKISDVHPFMGLAILSAVVLPWYVLIYREYGWTYIGTFFMKDNLGRYLSDSFGPARGPFYYFSVFGIDFFPWSVPAAAALYLLWRNRRQWHPLKSLSFGLPLVWCLLIFLLFSVSKNKQEYYIAPMYPIAAVIIAAVLDKSLAGMTGRCLRGNFKEKTAVSNHDRSGERTGAIRNYAAFWKRVYLSLSVLLLVFSIMVFFILRSFMPHLAAVLHYVPSLVIAAAAIWTIGCVCRRKLSHCFPAVAASVWLIFMMGVLYYFPALETFRPVKSFCKTIEEQANGNFQAGYFRVTVPSMVFYLRKQIFQEYNAASMIRRFRSDTPVFCILTAGDYAFFARNPEISLHVLGRGQRFSVKLKTILDEGYAPGKELLLVSNRPIPSLALKMPIQYNEK